MPKIASSVARARPLMTPLAAIAVTMLLWAPSAGRAFDRGAPRYAQNPAAPAARPYAQAQGPAQVYLLRGFLNVFSLGMDDIARRLEADGIAATVTNHADADLVASRILTAYNGGDHGPIVLIGHSLGADAVVEVADALAQYNVPIALLVLFDGTEPHQIPPNVASAINYTKHFMIAAAGGSRGLVSNVDFSADPSIDHLSIDTVPSLQAQTLDAIVQLASAATAAPRKPVSRRQ
jgi:hypothetical protein